MTTTARSRRWYTSRFLVLLHSRHFRPRGSVLDIGRGVLVPVDAAPARLPAAVPGLVSLVGAVSVPAHVDQPVISRHVVVVAALLTFRARNRPSSTEPKGQPIPLSWPRTGSCPPRRELSEVRQAINAATGNWPELEVGLPEPEAPGLRLARLRGAGRRALPWLGNVGTQVLAGVIAALLVILLVYLF